MFTYHRLFLLYYFHQKKLNVRENGNFSKKGNFFGQACFRHPENQDFEYYAYICPFCDIMNYLYIK